MKSIALAFIVLVCSCSSTPFSPDASLASWFRIDWLRLRGMDRSIAPFIAIAVRPRRLILTDPSCEIGCVEVLLSFDDAGHGESLDSWPESGPIIFDYEGSFLDVRFGGSTDDPETNRWIGTLYPI